MVNYAPNFFLPYCRRPGEKQRAALDLLQQRGRHQLPADALRAVRSPEAHHGAASGGGEGGHRQPGPHRPGNNIHTAPHSKSPGKPSDIHVVTNTSSSSPAVCQIYRLEDSCCLFTLQGHSGGITAIYIDQVRILLPVSKINSKLKLLPKKKKAKPVFKPSVMMTVI